MTVANWKTQPYNNVVYIAPDAEYEFRNTGDDLPGVLFICVPTGEGIERLLEAQSGGAK